MPRRSSFGRLHRRRRPLPAAPRKSWAERWAALRDVWATLLLFVFVIGGMYGGLFPPTEAGGMGAGGAFLLTRGANLRTLSVLPAELTATQTKLGVAYELTADLKLVSEVNGAYEVLVKVEMKAPTSLGDVTLQQLEITTSTQLNSKMFAYNENKQAYIADPDAGTFRQLVEAAEGCQVSIIHPGKPRNPKWAWRDMTDQFR